MSSCHKCVAAMSPGNERGLCGPRSRSGWFGENKILFISHLATCQSLVKITHSETFCYARGLVTSIWRLSE